MTRPHVSAARLLAVLLCGVLTPLPAAATVTYNGTEGIYANIFNANIDGVACMSCHSTTRTDSDGTATGTTADNRYFAAVGIDFNTYAATQIEPYLPTAGTVAYWANERIQGGTMPYQVPGVATDYPSTLQALSAADKSLFQTWINDGQPQSAAPEITANAESSVTAYGVTITGTVNDSGADASYIVQIDNSSGFGSVNYTSSTHYTISASASTTTASGSTATWTGGGVTTKSMSVTASGLSCNTVYYYRIRGVNSAGTAYGYNGGSAAASTFTTSACLSVSTASISNKNEATTYTLGSPLATLAAAGGSGAYSSWQVISGSLPAGLTLDGSTGKIYGTTPNLLSNATYNFTVQVSDGTTTASKALSITIVADNDAPAYSTGTGPTSAVEGSAYNYNYISLGNVLNNRVQATDPEGQGVTYTLNAEAEAAGMTIDGTSGLIAWTPGNGLATPIPVVVIASDGTNNPTVSWSITSITATNTPPEITGFAPTLTGSEDVQWSYQLTVSDLDDDSSLPGNITYTLGNAPTGMAVSNLGLITWTPSEAQVADTGTTQFSNITITVEDGDEDASTPTAGNNGVKTFTLTISPVNDPPVLASLPDRTVTELSAMTSISAAAVTYLADPDDSTGFTWSLSNQPTGMAIDASGVITYTPGQDVVPSNASSVQFTVTVHAYDPDLATDTDAFVVTVNKKDADSDLIADYHDNCLNTANNDQADNDGDGVAGGAGGSTGGDVCDTDDDNDGITDVAEIANGLDPFDAADAAADLDGDGDTNLAEFLVCVGAGDPTCTDMSNSVVTNGDIEVVATGYYTPVELSATAITIESGNVVQLDVSVDNPGPFRPGVHVLTWTATHPVTAAVMATEQQTVTVIPTVSLGGTVYSGEGRTANLQVQLNGESPEYPVYVDYTVSGTATDGNVDHDLAAGTVKITAGTSELVPINIVDDGMPEGDETVVVTLTAISSSARSGALSDAVTGTLVIADRQLAPEVMLWVEQDTGAGNERRTVLYRDQNKAYVDLIAVDPNGDALGWDWSASDPALALGDPTLVNTTPVAIDPSVLTAGETYDLVVSVSDGNGNIVERRVSLSVADTAPPLASVDTDGDGLNDDDPLEGTADSDGDGLLDYLDAITAPDILPVRSDGSETGYLRVVQAGAGYSIELGRFAIAAQDINLGVGAQVPSSGIVDGGGSPVPDDGYSPIGALYDVIVGGARDGQRTVQVAYSLVQPLPPQSTWRVFINGAWFTFAVTASDTLWSAPTDANGQCPSPDAAGWQAGLVAGSGCVRLVLSDGGPNDADGVVNGSVQTTGGAAIPPEQADSAAPDSEKGGTTHLVFLVLLALAGFRTRRSGK